MLRLLVGSFVAAIVMFLIGFGFYATPIGMNAYGRADPAVTARVQAALAELPATGTYAIPNGADAGGEAAYARGPVATVHFVKGGFPMFDPVVLAKGLALDFVSVLLLGLAVYTLRERLDWAARRTLIGWTVLGVGMLNVLGDPIWYRFDWAYALYVFTANSISLAVGALIVARWFVPVRKPW